MGGETAYTKAPNWKENSGFKELKMNLGLEYSGWGGGAEDVVGAGRRSQIT